MLTFSSLSTWLLSSSSEWECYTFVLSLFVHLGELDIDFHQPVFLSFWGCLALEFLLCKSLSYILFSSQEPSSAATCSSVMWVESFQQKDPPETQLEGTFEAPSWICTCTGSITMKVTFISQGVFCLRYTYKSYCEELVLWHGHFSIAMPLLFSFLRKLSVKYTLLHISGCRKQFWNLWLEIWWQRNAQDQKAEGKKFIY